MSCAVLLEVDSALQQHVNISSQKRCCVMFRADLSLPICNKNLAYQVWAEQERCLAVARARGIVAPAAPATALAANPAAAHSKRGRLQLSGGSNIDSGDGGAARQALSTFSQRHDLVSSANP